MRRLTDKPIIGPLAKVMMKLPFSDCAIVAGFVIFTFGLLSSFRGSQFLYAGAATYWDPSDADREYMRTVARRVGEAFRTQVGPGTFTVDGGCAR